MEKYNNIVLVGLMGSGKTTIGKKIASAIHYDFLDTDQEIEKISGKTIPHIFRKEGEKRFRSEETLVLKRLLHIKKRVIATGGGIVVKEENRRLLKRLGFIIYLQADTETIYKRVSMNDKRPLLAGPGRREKIEKLSQERKAYYEEIADFSVATDLGTFEQVVKEILNTIAGLQKSGRL